MSLSVVIDGNPACNSQATRTRRAEYGFVYGTKCIKVNVRMKMKCKCGSASRQQEMESKVGGWRIRVASLLPILLPSPLPPVLTSGFLTPSLNPGRPASSSSRISPVPILSSSFISLTWKYEYGSYGCWWSSW
ncbi:hypothetical protein PLEOSDRAFT_1082111 [Pleurotus ostreatus PC15]|uniref:Uncharacterized protein n=1 Tax=Pleurotus ostreatus (strain PC15) TaxID=1137138 RepID=A0A067NV18_PLEO1|nr:hypothetical protein PLEOSDRAFT_1082111 [Pleurotus ostreatus PC15]